YLFHNFIITRSINNWTDINIFIQTITHFYFLHFIREFLKKFIDNIFMYDNTVCTDTCLSCVSTAGFTTNVQPAANCIAPDSRFSALTTIVSLQARVQSCSFHNKKGLAPANPLYIFYFSDILQTKYDYVFSYFL